jgi:hypothetical protein
VKPSEKNAIEALFQHYPDALRFFHSVLGYVESIGPVKMKVTKTQVSFTAVTAFAWVWLPQMWVKKRPESSITLSFSLGHRVTDGRIAEVVEPRPGRFMHHVIIEDESGFSRDVQEWLREAYIYGGGVLRS